MLQIALAGLVLNKVMTLKEAEMIMKKIGEKPMSLTVGGVISHIELARKEIENVD